MSAAGALRAWIDGVALWSPRWPDWAAVRAAFARPAAVGDVDRPGGGPEDAVADRVRRPAPASLAANERRRAPDSVLVALQVAEAAVADAGRDASELASVFTSAHGDLPIIDALCRTLATDPLLLSPTRFHHSVHNAASGYWAIGSGSHAPTTALAAFDRSFAAGLLEALAQCRADDRDVLLVGVDTAACGALASVNRSRGLLGVSLVVAPRRGPRSRWQVDAALATCTPGRSAAPVGMPRPAPPDEATTVLGGNAMADALPLFRTLAIGGPASVALPLDAEHRLVLRLSLSPLAQEG